MDAAQSCWVSDAARLGPACQIIHQWKCHDEHKQYRALASSAKPTQPWPCAQVSYTSLLTFASTRTSTDAGAGKFYLSSASVGLVSHA